jgi:uncharacterized protein (TIGR02996 family)
MTEPHEPALLAAVRSDPADAVPRLVYADWLEEHGDADLAAYVRLECDARPFAKRVPQLTALCKKAKRPLGGWEYAADLARVRDKLAAVRKEDATFALFGAEKTGDFGHRYELSPPLPEPDLLAFEKTIGYQLPADYRAFLLRFGNGQVGPYYGLLPLDLKQEVESLRRPFPFGREAIERWADEPLSFDDVNYNDGNLMLSDAGCGTYAFLVVNGESRGTMWGSDGGGELVRDCDDAGEPHTFLSWYEAWLDNCLRPDVLAHYRKQQRDQRKR